MKRASRSLLSQITSTQKKITFCRIISRDFFSNQNENLSPSSPHIKTTKLLLPFINKPITSRFQTTPSRKFSTQMIKTPPLNPRQRKVKEKSDIEEDFESAVTTEGIMSAFQAMESIFDENDPKLGLACLKVGLHLEHEGEEPEKALEFGNRALNIFDKVDKGSISVAMTLQLMGSASYDLGKFNDSLGYLNKANKILVKLGTEGYHDSKDITPILHAVHQELAKTKNALGRIEDSLVHHKKCLEIKEMTLEPESKELGVANRELAEAYVKILNFKEAMPHCLKALQIHKAQLGDNSVEVARDRQLLGIIYTGVEEHQKALEQNQLSQRVLKKWGLDADLLHAEVEEANMKIALGKIDEAINTLKSVVQRTDKDSKNRAMVYVVMGNALCHQEKFSDAKRCLDLACGILEKKESAIPAEVAEAYMEIAVLYETMNEFETAITMFKKTLSMLENLPQEQHSEGSVSARLGWLLMLSGQVQQSIPYLENAVELLKESYGSKHYGIGYVYNNLGAAYLELDRFQSAAQMFAVAKEIMDVALGPHHADAIESCQNLSKAYAAMGSYPIAIEFQQRAVDAWESHGSIRQDEFREASRVLEQLKKKAGGSKADHISTKALPLPPTSESNVRKQLETIRSGQ
ncbi:hypothetical protein AQUCO_02200088v1 [Aquilegia coerulea]|uniref:Uncharacterized protein n=1 Tax=Aquilegia coerulea TaxID=218851 RepID=A0A2G5DD27_AQUCA|nr:hypothetical protein AQUCO_02200088v1 [Aquilegia coerulea]